MIQETQEITHVWRSSPASRVPPSELILVTDFDGTLAEIVQDPAAARARSDSLEALQELVMLLADVIVLSSRPPSQLEWLVPISGVRLIGDSGLALPRHAQREALDRLNFDASRHLRQLAEVGRGVVGGGAAGCVRALLPGRPRAGRRGGRQARARGVGSG